MLSVPRTREEMERELLEQQKKDSPGHKEKIIFVLILIIFYAFHYYSGFKTIEGKMEEVKSGDVFVIKDDEGNLRTIRIQDIYCPVEKQPFYSNAKKYTKKITKDKLIAVTYRNKDREGRLLGEVTIENGDDLAQKLVENGLAWRWKYSLDFKLYELQNEAKKGKKGLWKRKDPIPPWDWTLDTKEK